MAISSGSEPKKTEGGTTRVEEKSPCALCGETHPRTRMRMAASLRPAFYERGLRAKPDTWTPESRVCKGCLDRERVAFVIDRLKAERGALSEIEADIAAKAAQHLIVVEHIDEEYERTQTLGQRVADRMAKIGGSWPFLAAFFAVLAIWIGWNGAILRGRAFDPYPYILLNLVLSCVAAVQAPIIMMSQNRLAARDRAQADQDFRTNLKAEIEIVALHEKVDHLLHSQYERLVELQEVQLELLQEIAGKRKGG
jgi:uncharacterized membrane protein